jgi:hypothetical protein
MTGSLKRHQGVSCDGDRMPLLFLGYRPRAIRRLFRRQPFQGSLYDRFRLLIDHYGIFAGGGRRIGRKGGSTGEYWD